MSDQLLTRKQVAKIFGVVYRTVLRWEHKGLLKPRMYLNARQPRYHIDDIQKVYTETKPQGTQKTATP